MTKTPKPTGKKRRPAPGPFGKKLPMIAKNRK